MNTWSNIAFVKLREIVSRVFPQLSSRIETLSPQEIPDRMVEYPFVLRELNLENGRVLDVGSTSPYNIIPLVLADQGLEVWGIDVREFKISHPNFKFIKGDIRETDFPDSYFDQIIAISTIEHIGLRGRYSSTMDLNGDRKAILEMMRILKRGGNILITVPFGRAKIVATSHRIYDGTRLRKLFDGLKIVKAEFYVKNESGYWLLCEESKAEFTDASLTKEYAVACLNLSKP
jgi:SAM-dependent methyltransferase